MADESRSPTSTWQAPGRVNLIGDHTDYNDGFVLPFAIPQATTVTATLTETGSLNVTSAPVAQTRSSIPFEALAPNSDSWTSYVEGAVWLLRDEGIGLQGVDIVVDSDVPIGAGLSSSAAVVCATLCAVLELLEQVWTTGRIAAAARRVENDYVGAPVGIMDPTVVMDARPNQALFLDCRTYDSEQVPLDVTTHGLAFLVFITSAAHRTAGRVYAERVNECRDAARLLNVGSLRDINSLNSLKALPNPTLQARASHVVSENRRVLEAVTHLRSGDIASVGPLITASHASLRDDYEVSTPELDLVVSSALAAGALGARLTGAGLGGSAIVLARRAQSSTIAKAVHATFEKAGLTAPIQLDVVPAVGARRVPAP